MCDSTSSMAWAMINAQIKYQCWKFPLMREESKLLLQIESQLAALFLLVWIKVVNPIQKLKTGYSFVHGGWFEVDVHLSESESELNIVESNITPCLSTIST